MSFITSRNKPRGLLVFSSLSFRAGEKGGKRGAGERSIPRISRGRPPHRNVRRLRAFKGGYGWPACEARPSVSLPACHAFAFPRESAKAPA